MSTGVIGWGYNGAGATSVPTGLTGVTKIAAGGGHVLALKSDGTVAGWGYDLDGQADVPAGLTGVTAIAAGGLASLAVTAAGTVVAWGNDTYGQSDVPAGLTDVTAVSVGTYHSLALKSDGTVVAWGYNGGGETSVPADLTGVTAIAAGKYDSLALKSDGTVVAWGDNSYGETTVPASLTDVTALAAGDFDSLALKKDGTVVAWGINSSGQTNVPAGLTGATAIAAGANHNLALKSDGTVVGWGDGYAGGTAVPDDLIGVTAIDAGDYFSVALGRLKQPQTIAFASAAPSPGLVGRSYTPTATGGGSGQPVTFSIDSQSTSGACTFSAGVVRFTGRGTCIIDAEQAGNGDYKPAVTTSQTVTVKVAPAAWQRNVRGYTAPAAGSANGYTLGVQNNHWTMQVTHPRRTKVVYTGTATLDQGTFTAVNAIALGPDDSHVVRGNTLTFRFTNVGGLDGLQFTTPGTANSITFTLRIDGRPATRAQVFTGKDRATSHTASPVTYRRSGAE